MEVIHSSGSIYDIFGLKGHLKLSAIPAVTAEIARFVNTVLDKDLVFDLSELDFVDTSGLTLFINVDKRLKSQGRSLYLVNPNAQVKDVLETSGLTKVMKLIASIEEIDQQVSANMFDRYKPFSNEAEGGLRRLQCSCAVCGSKNVVGYLTDPNFFAWTWLDNNPFPSSVDGETHEPLDYYSIAPIVCLECFMASTRITDFNITSDSGSIVFKSKLDDNAKSLLSKSIKKRKKLMEIDVLMGDNFFVHPRSKEACYQAYLLSEFCSRTLAMLKSGLTTSFQVAFLNYIAIKYGDLDQKDEHIDNCRTWFTQALNSGTETTPVYETTVCYFALLIANMNLKKTKEAAQIFNDFNIFVTELPQNISDDGINSPRFWFDQAKVIWQKEIDAQSRSLNI